jgi:hypothetical protein
MAAMTEIQRKEIGAFISFFATFTLVRPVTTVSDLGDGAALFEVLALVCVLFTANYSEIFDVHCLGMRDISANLSVPLRSPQITGFFASAHSNGYIDS